MGNPGTLLIHVLSPITFLDEVYIHSVLFISEGLSQHGASSNPWILIVLLHLPLSF